MQLFDVYPLLNITPVKALGTTVWDDKGRSYLDLYGGHAVISIGHSHPHYIARIREQLEQIGFYSNSVQIPLQQELAEKLGRLSGYPDYQLFFCNSGAEANENALKLASFVTGRSRVISFSKAFHGRTSLAVALTDNPKIVAPANVTQFTTILPFNDSEAVAGELKKGDVAAVIIEGIQGVGGIHEPDPAYMESLANLCRNTGTLLILDEIQSGYGRTGKFFAHQYHKIQPDIITIAKGMGNGFPIGGVVIQPGIQPWHGMLGTTFGGNHLACAAALAVLEVMEQEGLMDNAARVGEHLLQRLKDEFPEAHVRGRGLMIGIEFSEPVKVMRDRLLHEFHIFTGFSGPNTIRLLPPLTLTIPEANRFVDALKMVCQGK